jgi:signal transduction histidine kinase
MSDLSLQRYRRRIFPLAVVIGITVGVVAPMALLGLGNLQDLPAAAASARFVSAFLGAGAMGVSAGIAVYAIPMRIIRTQYEQVERAIGAELAATGEFAALNRMLSQKVADEVAERHGLSQKMVDVQEQERRRIARELHDGVGQALAALRLEIDQTRAHPAEAGHRLREAARVCDEALAGIRQAVYDLRPPEIGATSLPDILRSYAERFELRSKVATSFRWRGDPITAPAIATCLLRILQEAFANISRYARAREVGVSVIVGEAMVEMSVQDDGAGFDPEAVASGSGLRGIKERCAFFGGTCQVESSPGEGTKLRVCIPIGRQLVFGEKR